MECGNHTEEDLELISSFNYWLEGVLMVRNKKVKKTFESRLKFETRLKFFQFGL